jgi:hypothetical protein
MDGRFNEVELLWIEEVLDQHGEFLIDRLQESIDDKDLIKSGDLIESISARVSHDGINPVLQVSFLSYGRAIEIAFHKKSSNTKLWTKPNTNQIVWGIRENKQKKKRKNTNWYSRNVYGSLNRLISIIMYELDEKEIGRLKGILQRRQSEIS